MEENAILPPETPEFKDYQDFADVDHLDWASPISDISAFLVARMKLKLDLMLQADIEHLCFDDIALGVAIEHGFKGSRKEIINQFLEQYSYRSKWPHGEADRDVLTTQAMRLQAHLEEEKQNQFRMRRRTFFETSIKMAARGIGSIELVEALHCQSIRMEELRLANLKDRHAKRECVCFCG